jgi:hypothetical protein
MRIFIILSLLAGAIPLYGQDLSSRVRQELLTQGNPITVNVSTTAVTTLQFPGTIQALESDGFSQKPTEETAADFYISPGVNWVSIRSLRSGAQQNLNIVIAGQVYPVWIQTGPINDFVVRFRFAEQRKTTNRNTSIAWSPIKP